VDTDKDSVLRTSDGVYFTVSNQLFATIEDQQKDGQCAALRIDNVNSTTLVKILTFQKETLVDKTEPMKSTLATVHCGHGTDGRECMDVSSAAEFMGLRDCVGVTHSRMAEHCALRTTEHHMAHYFHVEKYENGTLQLQNCPLSSDSLAVLSGHFPMNGRRVFNLVFEEHLLNHDSALYAERLISEDVIGGEEAAKVCKDLLGMNVRWNGFRHTLSLDLTKEPRYGFPLIESLNFAHFVSVEELEFEYFSNSPSEIAYIPHSMPAGLTRLSIHGPYAHPLPLSPFPLPLSLTWIQLNSVNLSMSVTDALKWISILPRLKTVTFVKCALSGTLELDSAAFATLPKMITRMDLAANDITELHLDLAAVFNTRLETIDLYDNPFCASKTALEVNGAIVTVENNVYNSADLVWKSDESRRLALNGISPNQVRVV
jgi:hypothetical protein